MEKILKINQVIAGYMGYEINPYQHNEYKPIYSGHKTKKTVGEQNELWGGMNLQFTGRFTNRVKYPFDAEFNYLIPVIRKIEESGFVVHIAGIKYQIYRVLDSDNPIVSLVCGDVSKKTEMVCDLIVQFIETINNSEA